jgi:anthranilate phosphoribosyltransferase
MLPCRSLPRSPAFTARAAGEPPAPPTPCRALSGSPPTTSAPTSVGFAENLIHVNHGGAGIRLAPGAYTAGTGGPADLRPVDAPGELVEHFLRVVSGQGDPSATEAVCLNAAALAMAGGHAADWATAVGAAEAAVRDGAARDLVERAWSAEPRRPSWAVRRG